MNDESRQTLVKNIRALMKSKNIESESELARISHVSQKTVNNLLNPEQYPGSPKLDTVERVAKGLHVSVVDLLNKGSSVNEQAATYGYSSEVLNLASRINDIPPTLLPLLESHLEHVETLAKLSPEAKAELAYLMEEKAKSSKRGKRTRTAAS